MQLHCQVADNLAIGTACTTPGSLPARARAMRLAAHSGSHLPNIDLASCLSGSKDA
jgi:hypothetical protein